MTASKPAYRGRFAPSPTGALHAGSLVAALASWLDAKAHGGKWLVRIEDVDTPRCIPGADHTILQQLAQCGLHPDAPVVWQSQRTERYAQALQQLIACQRAYPCGCTRKEIEYALLAAGAQKPRHGELIYPGTCRNGLQDKEARAWRFYTENQPLAPVEQAQAATKPIAIANFIVHWTDRRLGPQEQDVAQEVGDFVLKRADGLFAYQLAVVVDDAEQGITHVVRGEDLTDNTARQILLQRALGLPAPQYLHTPLVLGPNGEKLSKQNGARALELSHPLEALNQAAHTLGFAPHRGPLGDALAHWTQAWSLQYAPRS